MVAEGAVRLGLVRVGLEAAHVDHVQLAVLDARPLAEGEAARQHFSVLLLRRLGFLDAV